MIHPFFYELKKGAEHYLSMKGYDLISVDELTESVTYSYLEQHFIKVVNQGYDSPEVYLGKTDDSTSMIRLDFILELYLNNNMQLITTHTKAEAPCITFRTKQSSSTYILIKYLTSHLFQEHTYFGPKRMEIS